MLKSRGPSTDPRGTPRISSDQLLKLKLIFVLCQRLLKQLFINFEGSFENPQACSV